MGCTNTNLTTHRVFRFPDKTMKRSAQFMQFVQVKRQDITAALAMKSSKTSLSLHIILVEIAASNGGTVRHLAAHRSRQQLQILWQRLCPLVSAAQKCKHQCSLCLIPTALKSADISTTQAQLSELPMVVSDTSQLWPQDFKN